MRRLRPRGDVELSFPTFLPLVIVLLPIAFYLLLHFRSTGECICGPRLDRSLPYAEHVAELGVAPIVSLIDGEVSLNGMPFDSDDLGTLRNNFALLHPGQPFEGKLILMADRRTPFGAIANVRRVAARAGYEHVEYAVEHEIGEFEPW